MQIGYDRDFIGEGIRIPLPTFNRQLGRSILRAPGLRKNIFSDHAHFTVVMNEYTRQLVYSAYNIDQSSFLPRPPGGGRRSWRNDPNVKAKFQLDNDYYKDRQTPTGKVPNPYDRGHMVMRFNNMWGADNDESDKAGKATFIYSNSSLQHENLNRDEWKALEIGIVRKFEDDKNDRLAVFTGPIYGDLDRHINLTDQESARVPSGFFKVICYRRKTDAEANKLGVLAFAIFQDTEVLRDKKGGKQVKTNREYQVTISELQNWTGINFDRKMYVANPLFYNNIASRNRNLRVSSIPERIPVTGPGGVVGDATERRPEVTHLSTRRIVINSAMIDPKGSERSGEWIHCMLMPLVLAMIPLGGLALFLEHDLEVALIIGTVSLAVVSIGWGFLSHRKFRVLLLLGTAVSLIFLAHEVLPEAYEPWTMAAAGFFLATTHLINIRLCKACPAKECAH